MLIYTVNEFQQHFQLNICSDLFKLTSSFQFFYTLIAEQRISNNSQIRAYYKMQMKKRSKFYLSKQKKLKDLVKQIEQIAIEDERKKLKKIVSQRKQKWKESPIFTQLRPPKFNHIRKQYMDFSTIQPNASKQPFLTQKDKIKVKNSNRAYSSTPNIKTGAFQNKSNFQNNTSHPIILSRMFLQNDRLVDQQTLGDKINAQKKLQKHVYLQQCNKNINKQENLGKTYFQKFTTHRLNIDKTNDYHSIIELMTRKCITDRTNQRQFEQSQIQPKSIEKYMKKRSPSAKSKLFYSKKLKRQHSTLDTTRNDESESFDWSLLDKSLNTKKMIIEQEPNQSKKSIHSKFCIKLSKMKGSRVKFAKDINSVEF